MAKKKTKKKTKTNTKKPTAAKASSKATGIKAGKKPAGKPAGKPTRKNARKAALSPAPKKVSTGKGATPAELGRTLVDHFNAMAPDAELWKKHFHPRFVSIEGHGQAWSGRKAVEAKGRAWTDAHTVYSARATGPFVGATGFSVLFDMDVEGKDGSMPRTRMNEVGVYTVKNGKVVQEEFMYGP